MDIDIFNGPGNAAAKVTLLENETLIAEGGAMIAMSEHIQITTTTLSKNKSSVVKALKRLVTGESFFINHYTHNNKVGEVFLAATQLGDMKVLDLENENLILQGGSFVGCSEGVKMDMSFQGFKNLLSGEGLFWLKLFGEGKVIINSYGAIYPIEVDGDFIVDTGHIVAFDETLNFNLSKAGKSWISSFLGGEGFVCKFYGKGTVWCQSHNPSSFGKILGPKLKRR